MCLCLPFIHAMVGCGKTSSLYGLGKLKVFATLQSSQKIRSNVLIFGDINASEDKIAEIGEQCVETLYTGQKVASIGLDKLRYLNVISSSYVPFDRIPTTSRACHFHSLRVQCQISTWKNLETVMPMEEYGFKKEDGAVLAITTDKPVAPADLLKDIGYSCQSANTLCASCGCATKGLPCSIHYKCGGRCLNKSDIVRDWNSKATSQCESVDMFL